MRRGHWDHRGRSRRSRRWLVALLALLPLAGAASLHSRPQLPIVLHPPISSLEYERSKQYRFAVFQDGRTDFLQPGDILLGRCAGSPVPSLHPQDNWTHAALYVGNGMVVEAANPEENVLKRRLADWQYPRMTWVRYVRVANADEDTRRLAVSFALDQVGKPYDINWLSKQADGNSWYCSEMVWAAYLYGSGGSIDMSGSDLWGVSPDDLASYSDASVIGGHYEFKPGTLWSTWLEAFRQGLSAMAIALLALSLVSLFRLRRWSRQTGIPLWAQPGSPAPQTIPSAPPRAFHFPRPHADSYRVR